MNLWILCKINPEEAGAPVGHTTKDSLHLHRKVYCIIDGGYEWHKNTTEKEPWLRSGCSKNGNLREHSGSKRWLFFDTCRVFLGLYEHMEDIIEAPLPHLNQRVRPFAKVFHNGIGYGEMQLISGAFDVLNFVGKLSNEELHHG